MFRTKKANPAPFNPERLHVMLRKYDLLFVFAGKNRFHLGHEVNAAAKC